MSSTVREPAVAGLFYPESRRELERQLQRLLPETTEQHDLLACIAPHAGYVYSGGVAGRTFAHLRIPRRVVILGPNHTGVGEAVAVAPHERWHTPLDDGRVDRELAERLVNEYDAATYSAQAHRREHSLEVQLPFLQRLQPDLRFVAVCLKHLTFEACIEIGETIAHIAGSLDEPLGLVASSDMTHYRPDDEVRRLDREAIDAVLELDPHKLYSTVIGRGISMCGVIPATVALAAANRLGASAAHLVDYATSGDTSGDRSAVVGYAGICIHQ